MVVVVPAPSTSLLTLDDSVPEHLFFFVFSLISSTNEFERNFFFSGDDSCDLDAPQFLGGGDLLSRAVGWLGQGPVVDDTEAVTFLVAVVVPVAVAAAVAAEVVVPIDDGELILTSTFPSSFVLL